MFTRESFASALKDTPIEFAHLKVVQLAQAILESGRGSSNLYKLHCNPYDMKFRREMRSIADQIVYIDSAGETDIYCKFDDPEEAVRGYWQFIDRPPYSGWRTSSSTPQDYIEFIAYAGYIGGPFNGADSDRNQKDLYIRKIVSLLAEASNLLNLSDGDNPPPATKTWKAKGVLLEVGHGPNPEGFESGADGAGGADEREYDLNWIAAKAARNVIEDADIPCTITDFGGNTIQGDLYQIGQTAAGYDVFCSIHHNSVNGIAQGSEVFVHNRKWDQQELDLAYIMSDQLSRELAIRDRLKVRDPRQALGVLSGAKDTDARVAVLAEVYFIDSQVADRKNWSARGGGATIGRAIVKWLAENV